MIGPVGRLWALTSWGFYSSLTCGSRSFVGEAFTSARQRFGLKRKDGARAMNYHGSDAKGLSWSIRDLHKEMF